jgi:DNA (cytosine-5)-methyltransferase 1
VTYNLDARLALAVANPLVRRRYAVPLQRGQALNLERHPDSPDPSDLIAVRRWVRAAARPTALDLFCGAGGLSLGLADAGFTILAGADSDPFAVETHAANIPGLSYLGDLSDPNQFLEHLDAWGIDAVDLIAGGVPCQPFSQAGRSKIKSLVEAKVRPSEDGRVALWRSFVRVVDRLRPKVVLLENVPGLAEWEEGTVLVGFCESLRALGYYTDARILQAYEHGVPQHRSRLFIVAHMPGYRFDWPETQGGWPTLWDAIGDLPQVEGGQRREVLPYDGPQTDLQRRLRRGVSAKQAELIFDHITRAVRPDDLEAFNLMPEGGTYEQLPTGLQRYRNDIFTDKYKRLVRHELSRTITAHIARDGYWYIHPLQPRTLSVREAARVQTFPDSYRFSGPPSHRYRQIGNAVPPLLAEVLGTSLAAMLTRGRRRRSRPREDFRTEVLAWHRANARAYPWRTGRDPWHVLLAEMCLRRTRPDQVGVVYDRLVAMIATPKALVQRAEEIREVSASLGLHSTMESIVQVAEVLVDRFGGIVPDTLEDLLSLPGVGDYAANAVLCFGFGRPAILMDTNTTRIVTRVTGHDSAIKRWQLRLDLYHLAGPIGADPRFNSALLDFGALVCQARSPRCLACPVNQHCITFERETE